MKSTKRNPVRIHLDPSKRLDGYHLADPAAERRVALLEAAAKYGKRLGSVRKGLTSVQRRASVLSILFRRSNPAYAKRATSDAEYLASVRRKVSRDVKPPASCVSRR